ncbi:hypothetical protein LXL04_023830 [Taraxacum kok-saghyz]
MQISTAALTNGSPYSSVYRIVFLSHLLTTDVSSLKTPQLNWNSATNFFICRSSLTPKKTSSSLTLKVSTSDDISRTQLGIDKHVDIVCQAREEDEEIEIVGVGYKKPEIKDELPVKVAGGGANCWAVGDGWRRLKSSTGGVMGEIRDATGGCCLLAEIPGCTPGRESEAGGRP